MALTKSEKNQKRRVKEEVAFLLRIPRIHPHLLGLMGPHKYVVDLAIALKKYTRYK